MTLEKFFDILAYVLAAGFLFFGVQKFGATNEVFDIIAQRSGISLFEPGIRVLTGMAEIAVAVMLVLPKARTRILGAGLGYILLVGAIGFHVSPWLGINVPGIGHGLFFTAVALLTINIFALSRALNIRWGQRAAV